MSVHIIFLYIYLYFIRGIYVPVAVVIGWIVGVGCGDGTGAGAGVYRNISRGDGYVIPNKPFDKFIFIDDASIPFDNRCG